MESGKSGLQVWGEAVRKDVYEDLLSRYERILVYAGQLQEKVGQQKLLGVQNVSLEKQNERLKRRIANEESYAKLLENALHGLGILKRRADD